MRAFPLTRVVSGISVDFNGFLLICFLFSNYLTTRHNANSIDICSAQGNSEDEEAFELHQHLWLCDIPEDRREGHWM